MMKIGRIAIATGNSSPSVKIVYSTSRPRNAKRAKMNAAIAATGTVSAVEMSAIRTLFQTWCQNVEDLRIPT